MFLFRIAFVDFSIAESLPGESAFQCELFRRSQFVFCLLFQQSKFPPMQQLFDYNQSCSVSFVFHSEDKRTQQTKEIDLCNQFSSLSYYFEAPRPQIITEFRFGETNKWQKRKLEFVWRIQGDRPPKWTPLRIWLLGPKPWLRSEGWGLLMFRSWICWTERPSCPNPGSTLGSHHSTSRTDHTGESPPQEESRGSQVSLDLKMNVLQMIV